MKHSKLILRGGYAGLLIGLLALNTSCNDDPIEPLNDPNNQLDTTWVDDSTNWNPDDSTNWNPNGGGNTNPNDSTNWDPNSGGNTNPNDSTNWGGNTNPNDSLGGGN